MIETTLEGIVFVGIFAVTALLGLICIAALLRIPILTPAIMTYYISAVTVIDLSPIDVFGLFLILNIMWTPLYLYFND